MPACVSEASAMRRTSAGSAELRRAESGTTCRESSGRPSGQTRTRHSSARCAAVPVVRTYRTAHHVGGTYVVASPWAFSTRPVSRRNRGQAASVSCPGRRVASSLRIGTPNAQNGVGHGANPRAISRERRTKYGSGRACDRSDYPEKSGTERELSSARCDCPNV